MVSSKQNISIQFSDDDGFNSGNLGIVEYFFIVITHKSTLTWSGRTR